MQLLKQLNRWSCGLTSLSMLLSIREEILIRLIGHDGSEIIAPDAKEPTNHRGFVMDELQDVCRLRGFALAPYTAVPEYDGTQVQVYTPERAEKRLLEIMSLGTGLIEGGYALDKPHIVAWDGQKVFDPTEPRCYHIDDRTVERISVLCFWRLLKIKY